MRYTAGSEVPWTTLVADGVEIQLITEFYIGNPPSVPLVVHELSHLLLAAPDMYGQCHPTLPKVCGHSSDPGAFSIMSTGGGHFDPFHKLKLGWAHAQIIFRSGQYSLQAVEESHDVWILMDPARGTDEYFIVENRWRNPENYDSGLPDNGGLAVWHVMENPAVYGSVAPPPLTSAELWSTIPGYEWGRRGVRLIRPVWSNPIQDESGLWDGAQPGADFDLLSNDPDPTHGSLRWADGTPSGFELRDISAAGPVMSARITVP
jgi:hypothetical protein